MSTIFDYVRQQIPIVDVIQEYVRLRTAGAYLKGPCPFHKETDASFTVSPDKGIFYCFGCQATGDVIAFIARKENSSQREAVTFLIDQRKITVPPELLVSSASQWVLSGAVNAQERASALKACTLFAQWIQREYVLSAVAQEYCAHRGMNKQSVEYYGVGYFPSGTQAVNRCIKMLHAEGILAKDLISLGLFAEQRSSLISPFEERIIFPIRDTMNNICGFGGRVFRPGDDRSKYYNSKESELFSKGRLLFGLDKAKALMQEKRSVFLVEGYFDCVLMAVHGYKNSVATLGTACTQEHLKILARYVDRVYVMYDGDAAGKKAMLRLTQLCWEVNLELFIVLLPEKEDPASFLQSGNKIEEFIDHAQSLFSFFVQSSVKDFTTKSLSEKLVIVEEVLLLLEKIGDKIKRNLLLQEMALSTGIPHELLSSQLKKQGQRNFTKSNSSGRLDGAPDNNVSKQLLDGLSQAEQLEEHIFALFMQSHWFFDGQKKNILVLDAALHAYFSEPIRVCLMRFVNYFQVAGEAQASCANFLETLDECDRVWVSRLLLTYPYDHLSEQLFYQLVQRFCRRHWKKMTSDIKTAMETAEKAGDKEQLDRLFLLFTTLKQGIQSRGLI